MKRFALLVSLGFAVLSPLPAAADTLFSNVADGKSAAQPAAKAPAAKAPTPAATTFTLTQSKLITAIETRHSAAKPGGNIELLLDGKVVYSDAGLATSTTNLLVVQPYVVFRPGTYTVRLSAPGSWLRDVNGRGITLVVGESVPAGATTPVNQLLTRAGIAAPFSLTAAVYNAQYNPADLKFDLTGQIEGLSGSVESARSAAFRQIKAGQEGQVGGEGSGAPKSGSSKAFEGLKGENLAPREYTDTFGGQRFNRGKSGSPSDFSGGGRGNVSADGDDGVVSIIQGMLTDAGGKVTGDPQADAEEAAYMMSVGSDGWEATKNMSKEQRTTYWERERKSQLVGGGGGGGNVSRPNEGDEVSGEFSVFGNANMRRAMFLFQAKAISARLGAAGQREGSQAGGAARLPAGQDDKPQAEKKGGTINWNKVMQINTLINPVRH